MPAQELHEDLALKYLVQQPAKPGTHMPLLILLHGYGSNEADLFELRKYFPENFLVVSARAPIPINANGYEWYEREQDNGKRSARKADMDKSRALITQFIDQVVKQYKADPGQVYLVGFSQGAIMSYIMGVTLPGKLKGIAPLSGMLMEWARPGIKITPELKRLKIFIGHGTADKMVPPEEDRESYEFLRKKGLNPEYHTYAGMAHSISGDEIQDLVKWLNK
jgi:phospholipase/carboxylesterase